MTYEVWIIKYNWIITNYCRTCIYCNVYILWCSNVIFRSIQWISDRSTAMAVWKHVNAIRYVNNQYSGVFFLRVLEEDINFYYTFSTACAALDINDRNNEKSHLKKEENFSLSCVKILWIYLKIVFFLQITIRTEFFSPGNKWNIFNS